MTTIFRSNDNEKPPQNRITAYGCAGVVGALLVWLAIVSGLGWLLSFVLAAFGVPIGFFPAAGAVLIVLLLTMILRATGKK